jgi:hypothetical protein
MMVDPALGRQGLANDQPSTLQDRWRFLTFRSERDSTLPVRTRILAVGQSLRPMRRERLLGREAN